MLDRSSGLLGEIQPCVTCWLWPATWPSALQLQIHNLADPVTWHWICNLGINKRSQMSIFVWIIQFQTWDFCYLRLTRELRDRSDGDTQQHWTWMTLRLKGASCCVVLCVFLAFLSLSLSLSPIRNWVLAGFAGSTVLTWCSMKKIIMPHYRWAQPCRGTFALPSESQF